MQRFLFPDMTLGGGVTISETAFVHQISHVLRSQIGDTIVLFVGDGYDHHYCIQTITKKGIELIHIQSYKNESDPAISIRVYQSLPNKYEKVEYILQKWVEVGISEFVFFRSERSQKLIINDRKIERFREIVREATEQCGGNHLATISFVDNGVPNYTGGKAYFLHTQASDSIEINNINNLDSHVNIFVGPEGGWSERELMIFKERDIQNVHLWNRILRTETAGPMVAFFLIHK